MARWPNLFAPMVRRSSPDIIGNHIHRDHQKLLRSMGETQTLRIHGHGGSFQAACGSDDFETAEMEQVMMDNMDSQ